MGAVAARVDEGRRAARGGRARRGDRRGVDVGINEARDPAHGLDDDDIGAGTDVVEPAGAPGRDDHETDHAAVDDAEDREASEDDQDDEGDDAAHLTDPAPGPAATSDEPTSDEPTSDEPAADTAPGHGGSAASESRALEAVIG